jgi:hypothetical protein
MAWGYRLGTLNGREGTRLRTQHKDCSVAVCGGEPRYLSAYRYSRLDGRAVTVTRSLCTRHARLFSMKYSLAWPDMLRKPKRALATVWTALAAA